MTPAELMQKALRSLKAARLLLQDGDMDGACNRAYYAMFNAARALLLHAGHSGAATIKTHKGLIAAVAQFLVKSGRLTPKDHRALNSVFQIRLAADYLDASISSTDALAALEKADAFMGAIATQLSQPALPHTPKPAQKPSKKTGR